MRIRVRFFASFREMAGREEVEMELPPGTRLEGLTSLLMEEYPEMSGRAMVVHNRAYARGNPLLKEGDEVALFPPVSGG
ncbi:MAG: MoaD/ThiS family protein [Thermoplasmatota archaeon]